MTGTADHHEQDSTRFQLNSPQVADEEIDGEVIVINLGSGNYYSLLEEATEVWQLLLHGKTLGEITQFMKSRYEADEAEIRTGIADFVAELQQEGLIVPAGDDQPPTSPERIGSEQGSPLQGQPPSGCSPFTPPKLNVYIDMQQLMLLDPIHEVDETGWPSVKPPTP